MKSILIRDLIKKTLGFIYKSLPYINKKLDNGLTIFVFHEISNNPSKFAKEFGLAISTQTFRYQINWIKSNFNIIHPRDILSDQGIPKRAAIISFDDGFLGSFVNGLSILEEMNVPSILFLNMQAILEGKPILSAVACYLDRYVSEFSEFSKKSGLLSPAHLTLSPSSLQEYENQYGVIDSSEILDYQGLFADIDTVNKWDDNQLVTFGNHFFQHWNAAALSENEFIEQYEKNNIALSKLNSNLNLFAFTNGQPETCFSDKHIALLENLNAGKIFSAVNGVNVDTNKFILGRLSLFETDNNENNLWFRVGRDAINYE